MIILPAKMLNSMHFVLILLALVFVTSNNAQNLCYRCFGSNWCNNFTDPDFINNVHLIDCPATTTKASEYDGDNAAIARMLKNFEEASNRAQKDPTSAGSTWGCVTATLHEAHEVHTIRTCLNNAARICPTVQNVILNPASNDIEPGVYMDCEGCTGFLCNDQTFIEPEEETTTTTTTTTTSTTTTTTTSTTSEPPPTTTTSSTTTTTSTTTPSSNSSVDPPSSDDSSREEGNPITEEPPTPGTANVALVSFVALVLSIFANVL